MNFTLTIQSFTSIRLFTAIFSLILSIFAYHASAIINSDGILYIYTIDAFKAGGIAATESLYNWPFFPILTAWLSELTGWNTEFSVKALNSVLFILLTDALVLLSYKSLPNLRQVAIAAILILAFNTLNNYRDFIIRDIGYWAFACYALYQFVLYLEHQKFIQAISWQLLMMIALLFRIEAIVFLAVVPLYLLTSAHFQQKWHALLSLYSISFVFVLFMITVVIWHPETAAAFSKLQQLLVYFDPSIILGEIKSGTEIIEKQIMHPAADEHAARVLIFGLVLTVFWELISGISIAYLILLAMAWFSLKRLQSSSQQRFYIFIVLINILILSIFAIKSQLITTRYCVLGLLFLLLLLLPTLSKYISEKIDYKQKKILAFIGFLLFVSLADTMITTKAKPHLKTVPAWAAQNLPENAKALTTDFRIAYYFNKNRDDGTKINLIEKPSNINEYDYLIIYLKNDDETTLNKFKSIKFELIKEQGNSDNKVSTYAIKN